MVKLADILVYYATVTLPGEDVLTTMMERDLASLTKLLIHQNQPLLNNLSIISFTLIHSEDLDIHISLYKTCTELKRIINESMSERTGLIII